MCTINIYGICLNIHGNIHVFAFAKLHNFQDSVDISCTKNLIPNKLTVNVALFQLRDRPLIEKFYESGQKFLTMFPDGTGNVLYP